MTKNSGLSFFQKFISSIFGGNDPEAEKNRQLKIIAKNLSRSGYKFYDWAGEIILKIFL